MNRALLWLIGALLVGTVAGQLILDDPGFVLIGWHDWVLQTSLWIGLTALVLLLALALFAFGLLDALIGSISRIRERREARRLQLARDLAEKGLAQSAEGDWRKATSTLLKASELVDASLLIRLSAAEAAEADGRFDLARQVLQDAHAAAGEAGDLIDLRLAELCLRQGDAIGAIEALDPVLAESPRHARALPLAARAWAIQGDWPSLVVRLPALKKLLAEAAWLDLGRLACREQLSAIAADAGFASRKARAEALQSAWRSMPAECRAEAPVLLAYADALARQESVAEARSALEKAIEPRLGEADTGLLIDRYGRFDADKPLEQLATVEQWLSLRPTLPVLLLAAGRISLRNRLWGKARDYFEAGFARQPSPECAAELVRLYSRLGDPGRTEQYQRRLAELSGSELPDLPLPTARN